MTDAIMLKHLGRNVRLVMVNQIQYTGLLVASSPTDPTANYAIEISPGRFVSIPHANSVADIKLNEP